jgi:hypothetical protein
VRRILCGFSGELKTKRTGGERSRPIFCFLFPAIFFFLAPLDGTAQTEAEAAAKPDAVMVVMPVKADTGLQAGEFQNRVVQAVNSIEGYTARALTLANYPGYANAFPNAAPAPAYVQDSSFALTSEYYMGMDNRQHFQVWLWNSADGTPIFTDEMVFDNIEDSADYLPSLISWVVSVIPEETGPPLTREEAREIAQEVLAEAGIITREEARKITHEVLGEEGITAWEYPWFWLYFGLRGGGALNSYNIRSPGTDGLGGDSERGFDAEAAFTMEIRPWHYLSFQTEAILLLETFNTFKANSPPAGGDLLYHSVRVVSLSLLVPLLFKFPFEVGKFGLSFSIGPYFILPLTATGDLLENAMDPETFSYGMALPFGVCFGIDLGYRLGRGELFGGLRYNYDLGTSVAPAGGPYDGVEFKRQRLSVTLGFRIGFFETGGARQPGGSKPQDPP